MPISELNLQPKGVCDMMRLTQFPVNTNLSELDLQPKGVCDH